MKFIFYFRQIKTYQPELEAFSNLIFKTRTGKTDVSLEHHEPENTSHSLTLYIRYPQQSSTIYDALEDTYEISKRP
jgi:hypothetical protein